MSQDPTVRNPIPWARIIAESLAIILSILLAFGIDAAWAMRGERVQERAVLASLLVDFEDTLERVHESVESHERIRSGSNDLLRMVDDRALVADAATVDSLLYLTFVGAFSLNAATGALDALLASGSLEMIRNEELRALLATWPSRIEDSAEEERWIFNDAQQRLVPYLNSRIRARNVYLAQPDLVAFMAPLPLATYEELWSDPEFDNLVSYRTYIESVAIFENRLVADDVESIIQLISSELEP